MLRLGSSVAFRVPLRNPEMRAEMKGFLAGSFPGVACLGPELVLRCDFKIDKSHFETPRCVQRCRCTGQGVSRGCMSRRLGPYLDD